MSKNQKKFRTPLIKLSFQFQDCMHIGSIIGTEKCIALILGGHKRCNAIENRPE